MTDTTAAAPGEERWRHDPRCMIERGALEEDCTCGLTAFRSARPSLGGDAGTLAAALREALQVKSEAYHAVAHTPALKAWAECPASTCAHDRAALAATASPAETAATPALSGAESPATNPTAVSSGLVGDAGTLAAALAKLPRRSIRWNDYDKDRQDVIQRGWALALAATASPAEGLTELAREIANDWNGRPDLTGLLYAVLAERDRLAENHGHGHQCSRCVIVSRFADIAEKGAT